MDALLFKRPDNAGTILKSNNSRLGSPYTWGVPSLAISPAPPGLPHLAAVTHSPPSAFTSTASSLCVTLLPPHH